MSGADGRKLRLGLAAALFVWTCLTYAPVVHHDFVNFDDLDHVVHNPNLTRPPTLANLLTHFSVPYGGNLLPVYWISLQLGFAAHGANPAAFLVTNVLLHAASSGVLFAALCSLTGAVWRSAFVAAVFAVHPLHVESVAWVVERKDVLAGLFFMLALWAYAGYARSPRGRLRYFAVLLCFALGLMSKSSVVTLPAVLLLLDFWPLDRLRRERVLLEKLPLFALAALASALTVASQRDAGNAALNEGIGFGSRLANAIESYWSYLGATFWPSGLAVLYPHPYLLTPVSTRGALVATALGAALAALTGVLLWASRRRRYLAVGWLWYLGTLVPMIGLMQVGIQARADRYMYLPLVGLAIGVAWGAGELLAKRPRALAAALAGGVLVALTLATREQVGHWANTITLLEHGVAVTQGNLYLHERLAFELHQAGRPAEASEHWRAALAVTPRYSPAYYGLAKSLEALGDRDAAIEAWESFLRREPDAPLAPSAHGAVGMLLLEAGRLAEAKRHLRVAARAQPDSAEYRAALAKLAELEAARARD